MLRIVTPHLFGKSTGRAVVFERSAPVLVPVEMRVQGDVRVAHRLAEAAGDAGPHLRPGSRAAFERVVDRRRRVQAGAHHIQGDRLADDAVLHAEAPLRIELVRVELRHASSGCSPRAAAAAAASDDVIGTTIVETSGGGRRGGGCEDGGRRGGGAGGDRRGGWRRHDAYDSRMQFTNLGNTGLKVSRLCLGMMTYGSTTWRPWILDEDAARPFFQRALERGINFFDTADMYSRGVSEEVIGPRAARSFAQRDQVVIATKVFFPMGDGPNERRPVAQAHPRRRSTRRCAGSASTTSTSTRSTASTTTRRSRRRSRRLHDIVQVGQGALHRRVEHVRVAVREDAAHRRARTAGRGSSRCRTTTTWSIARKSAR